MQREKFGCVDDEHRLPSVALFDSGPPAYSSADHHPQVRQSLPASPAGSPSSPPDHSEAFGVPDLESLKRQRREIVQAGLELDAAMAGDGSFDQ